MRYVDVVPNYQDVLINIATLVENDLAGAEVQFQVTACYYLRNVHTGELRKWTGSFSTINNFAARITHFIAFDPAQFVPLVLGATQNLEEKLTWNEVDTDFEFYRLISVIFNFQALVASNHHVLDLRELRHKRRQTFYDLL